MSPKRSASTHPPHPQSSDFQHAFVRGSVEHWQKPSEMFDELAQLIALAVGWSLHGEGLVEGARRYAPSESRGVDLLSHPAWTTFIQRLVTRDRLRAWKLALHGWLETERRLLLLSPNEAARRARDELAITLDRQWATLDDMPPAVAARYAYALIVQAQPEHTTATIARLQPSLLFTVAAYQPSSGGPIPTWLLDLAAAEPIRTFKLGLEAFLRSRAQETFQPPPPTHDPRLN